MPRIILVVLLMVSFLFTSPLTIANTTEDEYLYLPEERQMIDLGEYDKVRTTFEEALRKAEADKNTRDIAKYKKNIGDTYLRTANYLKAIDHYNQAEELLGTVDDKKLARSIYHNLGVAYASQGKNIEAEPYYLKALEIAKQLNYTYGLISEYNNLGNLYFNQGNYDKALEYLEEALKYATDSGISEYEFSVRNNLANIYNFKGEFDQARQNYDKILETAKTYQDQTLYADTLHNLATLYSEQANYNEAVKKFKEALAIYQKKTDQKKIAQTYLNLGTALLRSSFGKDKSIIDKAEAFDLSFQYFNQSMDVATKINAIDTAIYAYQHILSTRNALLSVCSEQGQDLESFTISTDELSKHLNEQGKEDIKTALESLNGNNSICSRLNLKEERLASIANLEKLIEFAKEYQLNVLIPDTLMSLANDYYWAGSPDKAVKKLQEVIQLKEGFNSPDLWHAYYLLGWTYQLGTHQNDKALEAYNKAIAEVKKLSNRIVAEKDRSTYIENKQDLFKRAAGLMFDNKDYQGARELIEFAKLSEQSDYILPEILNKPDNRLSEKLLLVKKATEDLTRSAAISNDLNQELTKTDNQQNPEKVNDLKQQLNQARLDFQKIAVQIQQEYPDVLKYVAIKPTNIRTIQRMLPDDTILIEPVVLEDRTLVFLGPASNTVPSYKEIKEATNAAVLSGLLAYRKAIYSKDKDKVLEASVNLYDLLIRPIEKDIAPYKVLIISPYENLRYIPFQSLYDGKTFLVEKFAVVNATSSSGLKIGGQQSHEASTILAFGNATEDLPASETEVLAISKMFTSPKVYLRSEASRNTFDKEIYNDYNIVHLATHGALNNDNPEHSKLLFAGSDNNFLTVNDIMAYDFSDKSLIVLSACDSAVGKAKGAEVSALGNAFELAAAPTIVASLWKVSDRSTSILMENFYKNLNSGMTKADALKAAQMDLIHNDEFKNPYYWAAFILLGEWK